MTILVIAEHDHGAAQGRDAEHRDRRAANAAATCTCWSPATTPPAPRKHAAQIAGVAKVLHRRCAAARRAARRERRRAGAGASPSDYSHILFPATAHGKNVAPRVAAKLDVAQISDITKVDQPRHLRAPDLRRQRDRHRAERRQDQGHHRAHHRLRPGGRDGGSAPIENDRRRSPTAASAASSAARSPRATGPSSPRRRSSSRGGRAMGSSDKFNEVLDAAGRQARRRAGRQPRRGRRGLRAERLAGRPDRQDRRAAAVHRLRHLAARSSTWPA